MMSRNHTLHRVYRMHGCHSNSAIAAMAQPGARRRLERVEGRCISRQGPSAKGPFAKEPFAKEPSAKGPSAKEPSATASVRVTRSGSNSADGAGVMHRLFSPASKSLATGP
jgi:hypothetical protein